MDAVLEAAGTVAVVRDSAAGLEVLMARRADTLRFAAGAWVFPGGRVDPGDSEPGDHNAMAAARRAATREAQEEAGIALDPPQLVPLSHWTPPPSAPRRFATWIFLADGNRTDDVQVDGSEIVSHRWAAPANLLADRDGGRVTLLPPTWVTLWFLQHHNRAADALSAAAAAGPADFQPKVVSWDDVPVCVYEQDAAYPDGELGRPGERHRLVMATDRWSYVTEAEPAVTA